jgi:hypothetical protein
MIKTYDKLLLLDAAVVLHTVFPAHLTEFGTYHKKIFLIKPSVNLYAIICICVCVCM